MKFAAFVATMLVAACAVSASIIPVDADYSLQYGTDGFQTYFTAQIGQTVDVDVYLYEFLNMTTYLLDDYDGLSGVGTTLQRTDLIGGPVEPAFVADDTAISPNGSFDEPNPYFSPVKTVNFSGGEFTDAGLNEYIYYASPNVQPSVYDATTKRIYIGTFTFTIGSIAGEVTSLNITDFNSATYDTVTGNPEAPIDHLISDFAFTITAIPEPASLSLLALGAVAAIARKRK